MITTPRLRRQILERDYPEFQQFFAAVDIGWKLRAERREELRWARAHLRRAAERWRAALRVSLNLWRVKRWVATFLVCFLIGRVLARLGLGPLLERGVRAARRRFRIPDPGARPPNPFRQENASL